MKRPKPKKTTLTGTETTPFDIEALQKTHQELAKLPKVGEPIAKQRRKSREGAEFAQAKEYLIPTIIKLFELGYDQDFVTQTLAEKLQVGKTNIYLVALLREAKEKYISGGQ